MNKILCGIVSATLLISGAVCASAKSRGDQAFDDGWRFACLASRHDGKGDKTGDPAPSRPAFDDAAWRSVTLPHDWSVEGAFAQANPMGGAGGFLPAGIGWYRKSFTVPAAWRGEEIGVAFDGVYMNAEVWINGVSLGKHPYGYTAFRYDLTPHLKFGGDNVIAVRVDNAQHKNSRWYSGSGIYRHVTLSVKDPVHVAPWGVRLTTPEVTPDHATLQARTRVVNDGSDAAAIRLKTYLLGIDGTQVGRAVSNVTLQAEKSTELSQRIAVPKPALWSPDAPNLYRVVTCIVSNGQAVDTVTTPLGIRSIDWSTTKGFQLNGKTIKFCGGCAHHDNGILGAAAPDRAEERRVELLKRAGFNAVRTSHNPPSPAFLDACDRLGLLVIDEAFDCWNHGKNDHDYHEAFHDWWQRDLDALVLRDMNHPAVMMWSIGNELPEQSSEEGAETAKMLADYVRKLDPTRPVTCAMNNAKADHLFAALDIGGYNYMIGGHAEDHRRVPGRVMVCTETFSHEAFDIWALCHDYPYITGDFVWTALDYLGEAGIGRYQYETAEDPAHGGHGQDCLFPWHGAYCGDLDICGFRKPWSWYRDIMWNGGDRVYVSVRDPQPAGTHANANGWGMQPEQASWTWPGQEGKAMQVEVYSACEAVRLYSNGHLLGEKPTTRKERFKAEFSVPYATGELKAVGLRGGKPVTECVLRTAGKAAQIHVQPDRTTLRADGQDLVFCAVEVTDSRGLVRPDAAQQIQFSVSGPAMLMAAGNGDVHSTEPYTEAKHRVFHGRALVVLRTQAGTAGVITLKATAAGLADGEATVKSQEVR